MDFNSNLLLPVEVRKTIVVGQSGTSGIATYLTASNGAVISMGIPQEWANYIAKELNTKSPVIESDDKTKARLIYAITIPIECMATFQGMDVNVDLYGNVTRKATQKYANMVSRTRNNIAKWRRHKSRLFKYPVFEKVHVIADIYVQENNEGTLPQFLAVVERLLWDLRIIRTSRFDPYVKSFDGSRLYRVKTKEECKIEITVKEFLE